MQLPDTVLIIDDNHETLETMKLMLKNMGVGNVHIASNVPQARHMITDMPYISLIVCDWNMPEETGIDLLSHLRHEGNLTPFIMVTARSDTDSVLEASNKGVDLYICKPFSSEELQRKIGWVTKGKRRAEVQVQFAD
jgi:two-component system, chemotaxis family, chemotaxis protein CheY